MDHDQIQRALADLEKRVARLERAGEKPPIAFNPEASKLGTVLQWCHCGRDVCRAPDCVSHKKGAA